jgi:hypothetical protein
MPHDIRFRPDALAASMARTLTLRNAPDALRMHWARSQMIEVELLIPEGATFELSPLITALADSERSGFAGRVGAGMTDLVMNSLGYVWRDNAAGLTGAADPHGDFMYAGGAATGHGVVLAEGHGSFAQAVSAAQVGGEARRKYKRQVKPHINTTCEHGKVIHGYAVAFGSHPVRHDTHLHVAETRIAKPKGSPAPPGPRASPTGPVVTSLALAAHRANFLLMGASNVVAWIDWLRGAAARPADDAVTTFLTVELAGARFLVATEQFLPFIRPWDLLDDLNPLQGPWVWDEWERWRLLRQRAFRRVFAMDEWAAKEFLLALSRIIPAGPQQMPAALELPTVSPLGLMSEPDRRYPDPEGYPVARFRDGLALLGRLPRSHSAARRRWSPDEGFI